MIYTYDSYGELFVRQVHVSHLINLVTGMYQVGINGSGACKVYIVSACRWSACFARKVRFHSEQLKQCAKATYNTEGNACNSRTRHQVPGT